MPNNIPNANLERMPVSERMQWNQGIDIKSIEHK